MTSRVSPESYRSPEVRAIDLEGEILPSTFDKIGDVRFRIIEMLDRRSREGFARTSKSNHADVQEWVRRKREWLLLHEDFSANLSFFCPEWSKTKWMSEIGRRALPAIAGQIDSLPVESGTKEARAQILQWYDGDPSKLAPVLQFGRNVGLVSAYQHTYGQGLSQWFETESTGSLNERARGIRELFQQGVSPHSLSIPEKPEDRPNIPYLPTEFLVPSIEKIYLPCCRLTALPDSLERLIQLTSADFSGNRLRSLPPSFGSLKALKALDMSHNPLESLPDSFRELSSLKTLRLVGVKLTPLICQKIPSGVHVYIDSKYRWHPHDMSRMFPKGTHIHYERS